MNNGQFTKFRVKMRQLERDIENQTEIDGNCCGVTLAQCHALLELEQMGTTSIKDLAAYLELDKSTLSRTIDTMVNMGWVERVINKEDRRFMDITLSAKGKRLCKGINETCNEFYSKVFDNIPKEKHDTVLESLAIFIDAIFKAKKSNNNKIINCCIKNPSTSSGTDR